jgi:hypothetical protein
MPDQMSEREEELKKWHKYWGDFAKTPLGIVVFVGIGILISRLLF